MVVMGEWGRRKRVVAGGGFMGGGSVMGDGGGSVGSLRVVVVGESVRMGRGERWGDWSGVKGWWS
ncbi:unnamed protein product [Prunus armeniaca]|uniref:Uncharacterized protein n=1 Tax=Prunus armeniaca TaxID=36596 RepID=A0A6J5X4J7_PRUAR|nr:unnamed protein product [Prunus armeniaca]